MHVKISTEKYLRSKTFVQPTAYQWAINELSSGARNDCFLKNIGFKEANIA